MRLYRWLVAPICWLAVSTSFAADPLAEFEALLGRNPKTSEPQIKFFEKQKAGQKVHGVKVSTAQPDRWGRLFEKIEVLRYDVKRTDSLVTPFTAFVFLRVVSYYEFYPTEADARQQQNRMLKPAGGSTPPLLFHLDYGYQKGKWQFVSGKCDWELMVRINNGRWENTFTDAASLQRSCHVDTPLVASWLH